MEKPHDCEMCQGDGYFDDFQAGLYPMPCPNCAGIGISGAVSEDVKLKIAQLKEKAYNNISAQTQRLEIAGQLLRAGVLSGIYLLEGNASKARDSKKLADNLVKRLQSFPQDYISVESEVIKETWEQVVDLVDDKYKSRAEQNKKRIVDKTLREIVAIELQSKKARSMGFGYPAFKIN
ncbi:hypothetical protein HYV88_00455 [Candidatus Woesearchaeota archaeon]|nr:hypothetical protein [Candidatus Woesearchaeota archaeon]